MYAVDELTDIKNERQPMSAFKGILSAQEAEQLQEYVRQSREEWDNI